MYKLYCKKLARYLSASVLCFLLISAFTLIAKSKEIDIPSIIAIENNAKASANNWDGDEIRRAIELYEVAARNWEAHGDFEKTSTCLIESAKLSLMISNLNDVEFSLNKALVIDKKINNIEGQVIAYSLFIRLYSQKNNLEEAEQNYKKAIKLSESSSNYAKAFAHFIAGEYQLFLINLIQSKKHFESAEIFAKQTNDIDLNANIILKLGVLNGRNNLKFGVSKIDSARQLWKKINSKRGIALTYNALGFLYSISYKKHEALSNFEEAKQLFPENVDYLEQVNLYGGLVRLNGEFGRMDLAIKNAHKALEKSKKSKYLLSEVSSLQMLANLYYQKGDTVESKKILYKAVTLSKPLKSTFLDAIISEGFGDIAIKEGRFDVALQKFRTANKLFTILDLGIARIQNSLAVVFEKKGQIKKARTHYQIALVNSIETKESIQQAEILYNLARLSKNSKNINKALEELEESIKITESIYNDVGNHTMRKSYLSNSYDRYELYIDLLNTMHKKFPNNGYDLRAFKASDKSRSQTMRENLYFADADTILDAHPKLAADEKETYNLLISKKLLLTELLRRKHTKKEKEALESEVKYLKNRWNIQMCELRRISPVYSSLKTSNEIDINKFQNEILNEDTMLLEFFFGKENSYVWLIEHNKLTMFTLPNRRLIENKIEKVLNLLVSYEQLPTDNSQEFLDKSKELDKTYKKEAKDLSQLLLGQFADKLENKTLLIVRDGKLSYLPISALPSPLLDEYKPILLSNPIIYQPSSSMLLLIKTKWTTLKEPQKDFLIYTDPVYSTDDPRLKSVINIATSNKQNGRNASTFEDEDSIISSNNFKRLEASNSEIDNIFKYYSKNKSKVVKSFEANRENFLIETHNEFKVLHFATHGIFKEENPDLSGLVLSEFDKHGNSTSASILLQDVYKMKLSADLVVLSACDTAVGENIKGEGLMSLTNGFLQAGAKSIVSSHWKVDDEATKLLMKTFYETLAKDENIKPFEALQKAKIKLYKNQAYNFPYFWASFTIHGDFQNKPKLTKKFNYTNYFIGIVLAFFVLGAFQLIRLSKNKLAM